MSVLIFCIVMVLAPLVTARLLWPDWKHSLRSWAETRVRPVLLPPQTVTIRTLQTRILNKVMSSATITCSGQTVLPCQVEAHVSPSDYARMQPFLALLQGELARMTGKAAERRGWSVSSGPSIRISEEPEVRDGRPEVSFRYRSPVADVPGPAAAGLGHRTRVSRTQRFREPLRESEGGLRTKPYVACELIRLDEAGGVDLNDCRSVTIGRETADYTIEHSLVSAQHAELTLENGQWVLHDLASLNGTWVNGTRVTATALIHDDVVSLAHDGPRFVFSRLSRDNPARREVL